MNIYSDHYDVEPDEKELYKIDFTQDEDFMMIFRKNIVSTINKFLKKFRICKEHVIFATDCRKTDIWRRSYFDGYKLSRINSAQDETGFNRGPLFGWTKNTLIPELQEDGYGPIIGHPIAEGDDIIAISKMYLRELDPHITIAILTCDHDFLQLVDDNTKIYNAQEQDLKEKSLGNPKKDLLMKILIGDRSDEIPKCFDKVPGDKLLSRGFGEKTCKKVVDDPKLLEQKFKEYPEAKKQFETNYRLVSFTAIPQIIIEDVKKDLNDHFSLVC
jgi:5'-3' exonuclease